MTLKIYLKKKTNQMVHFDLLKKNRKNYKIKDDLIEREITNKTA